MKLDKKLLAHSAMTAVLYTCATIGIVLITAIAVHDFGYAVAVVLSIGGISSIFYNLNNGQGGNRK